MFGDSIDQIISMKSNLKMYAEELDSNRNKQRFKDRTFHISLLAAIGYSIVAYDTVYNPEKDGHQRRTFSLRVLSMLLVV